jgi:anthranilate synthase component 2
MTDQHVLLLDNHDSFTFNLVDAFTVLGAAVDVIRNDASVETVLALAAARQSSLLVISPGPGTPEDAGCAVPLIRTALGQIPIFGVCLGHQAMVTALGGVVGPAGTVVHGRASRVRHNGHPIFSGIPAQFEAGRYHSLAALSVPADLIEIASCGAIPMAIAHRDAPAWGVQFHPESILTAHGAQLLGNVLRLSRRALQPEVV